MPRKPTSSPPSKEEHDVDISTLGLNDRMLTFVANDLGRDLDLMCTFQKLSDKRLPYDQQQVCWRVIKLGPKGTQTAGVTYKANTAFFVPQTDAGNIVYPLVSGLCSTSERVRVEADGKSVHFTHPEKGSEGLLEAVNNMTSAVDIGIGFTDSNGENLSTGLIFKKVGVGASVKAEFTPVLMIYATSNYQENEMLRGQIIYPLVWSQNLIRLDHVTKLRVTVDPITNLPKILKVG